jgi:hypothetical protein
MMWLRAKLKAFIDDPLSTAIELFVYLIILGVAVYLVILGVRWALGFIGSALR